MPETCGAGRQTFTSTRDGVSRQHRFGRGNDASDRSALALVEAIEARLSRANLGISRFLVPPDLPTILEQFSGLLKLRVLCFRSDENRNVRVGIFPKRQEILIGRLGLGGVALHRVRSAELEMGECTDRRVPDNSAMVEDSLELYGGLITSVQTEKCRAANVDRIESS